MRPPRMTIKRWLIAVASIAAAIALRQFAGDLSRQQASYCGAYANSAIMDVAGFKSEAKDAFKKGDQQRFIKITRQLATAQSQHVFYSRQRERYETAAWLLGMAAEPDYLPPGWPPAPVPYYSGSR